MIHGNRVVDNTVNGLFVRIDTPAGDELEKLTVTGRFNDEDIVHALKEVDAAAMAWAQAPEQVVEILQYVTTAR